MRWKKGHRAKRRNDSYVGIVVKIKERGVAGSAVTYVDWIEIEYDNGMIVRGDPNLFERVEDA